jgi:serine/threonine-protein kinase
MATVFLAKDLKHHRQVAIKVLHPQLAAVLGPERFLREIEIAAGLIHPHILPLYDSGEAYGLLYYVMPFVEGKSLRDRLNREPQLPLPEALRITRNVADALTYAHGHGVVHRDVKPENILLSGESALVADFGIARAIRAADPAILTETGIVVGTPLYMSPEQAAGERVIDGRSDIYSLGCVVYEMLAGGPPFTGPSAQALQARHALDPVPPLRTIRPGLPAAVDRAVGKALAKAPADRFQSATTFSESLTDAPTARSPFQRISRTVLFLGVGAGVLVGGYVLLVRRPAGKVPAPADLSIAVLAFKNVGNDSANEPFSDGMSDELTTALGKIEGLRVAARSTAFSFKKTDLAPQEVGKRLNVLYVLDGGVRMGGNRRRVSAQLISVANGNELWSDEYDRDAKDRDVFAIQDEITHHIVAELRVHLSGAATTALAKHGTASPEAHDLYQQGRYFFAKRDRASLLKAQDYFERAIQQDSTYALAYAGLSDTYSHSSVFGYVAPKEAFPKAKAAAARALALDSTLVEVHTSLGFIALFYDLDLATARRELDEAVTIDPRYAEARLFRAWYFWASGRVDDAVAEARTAVALDPFSQVYNTRLVTILYYARRYDDAVAQARHTLELDSTFFQVHTELARAYLGLGRCGDALAALEHRPEVVAAGMRGFLGYTYARCGRRAQAVAELERLTAQARDGEYVSHYAFATILAGLNEPDQTLAELDSAYAERTWAMFSLRSDPTFDNLHADPRFARLVKKVGVGS